MKHGSQHTVPQTYLRAWTDPTTPEGQTPYVWRISRDGTNITKKAPKNLFCETDMYTIHRPDGSRDLTLERGLSGLENAFASIRRTKLTERVELSSEDQTLLVAFVAAMHSRSKQRRNFLQKQWGDTKDWIDSWFKDYEESSPERRKRIETASAASMRSDAKHRIEYDDIKRMAEQPLQHGMTATINVLTSQLSKLEFAILCTNQQPGFITSDAPCSWVDPCAHARPPALRNDGLAYKTIEITLPISPSQLILLSWHDIRGYREVTEPVVNTLNRRTRITSEEYIVSNSNVTKECWFNNDPKETKNA